MKILWMPRAQESLQVIVEHIAQDEPATAVRFVDDLIERTERIIGQHLFSGRKGRVAGTYEWVAHQNYIMAYRVTEADEVHVLDVVHAARLWPGSF